MMLGRMESSTLRETLDSLREPDVMGPLDELTEVLVVVSALVATTRRRAGAEGPLVAELGALDDAFSRSVVLTRALRERLQARPARTEYASVSHAAREVVGRLHGVVPDDVMLSVRCPQGPAIVAGDRTQLRRLIAVLVESALAAIVGEGAVVVEVREHSGPAARARRAVHLEVRTTGVIDEDDSRITGVARPAVLGLGGTLEMREALRGGAMVTVRLPGAL